jgi:hypothetical protein
MKKTLFTAALRTFVIFLCALFISVPGGLAAPLTSSALDPTPPTQTVRLIFIHHSTGENWLRDDYGILGKTLGQNNYFVSDTNYGWGPNSIGDRTDIPNWREWFRSASTPTYMTALYAENGQHSSYTRTLTNPGGQNTIIMFKSCFPNSNLAGNPTDEPDPTVGLTVGHAKYVYNEILKYFRTRPDKLFVVITAPPVTDATYANNARAFNNWLVNDWLTVNSYPFSNVAVFDFYNVLTDKDAHHRYNASTGEIEHIVMSSNTLYYPSGDDHPNVAGSQKATQEFIPLLNIFYHRWKADDLPAAFTAQSKPLDDGWILESGENSNAGGKMASTGNWFIVGDNAQDRQYRSVLSFDTSSLPDTAVVTAATLKIKKRNGVGTNPFTVLGNLLVDVRKGSFSNNPALQLADFQASPSAAKAATFVKTPSNNWYSARLSDNQLNKINQTGLTQFRLRFSLDDNDNGAANYLAFYSGSATDKPTLLLTYYIP